MLTRFSKMKAPGDLEENGFIGMMGSKTNSQERMEFGEKMIQ